MAKRRKAKRGNGMGQSHDAIAMLKEDHRRVRGLFEQYEAEHNPTTKRQIAEEASTELETHAQMEELVFYPAFEDESDEEGQDLVEEARQEHQQVKELIAKLRRIDSDEEFDRTFQELMDNVEHHVEEEESEMFPMASEVMAEDLEDLMEEMQEVKHQLRQ